MQKSKMKPVLAIITLESFVRTVKKQLGFTAIPGTKADFVIEVNDYYERN